MKTRSLCPMAAAGVLLLACATPGIVPRTEGEVANNYGYHPIDPLPVNVTFSTGQSLDTIANETLLASLPDETIRLAIGEITATGSLVFGPAKSGYAGRSYMVVLDYIKFDTRLHPIEPERVEGKIQDFRVLPYQAQQSPPPESERAQQKEQLGVPFYVGVGLRLTANVTVNEGTIDLGNLIAIGAAAQAKKVSGTLVVQTLGISGGNISSLIPMPSEINASTIQNAIVSLGAIKAKMYEGGTIISPRVLGVYNNLGGDSGELINQFIARALQNHPSVDLAVRSAAFSGGTSRAGATVSPSSAPAAPAASGSRR